MLIGVVLAATAALLAYETKGLLIGERADPEIVESIRRLASERENVSNANAVVTVHLAPRQILVALSLEFADHLRTPEIEAEVLDLERRVRQRHPEVMSMFVKPQTQNAYRETTAAAAEQAASIEES